MLHVLAAGADAPVKIRSDPELEEKAEGRRRSLAVTQKKERTKKKRKKRSEEEEERNFSHLIFNMYCAVEPLPRSGRQFQTILKVNFYQYFL